MLLLKIDGFHISRRLHPSFVIECVQEVALYGDHTACQ